VFARGEQISSGESWDDGLFGQAAAGGDGGSSSTGEIVAVRAGDAFDDVQSAQAGELSGEGGGRALAEERQQIRAAEAGDVEGGTLQGREQGLLDAAEEVEPSDIAAVDGTWLGEAIEGADPGREVVQTGEVFEVAAVATAQDVTEVVEAVDVLLEGSEAVSCRTVLMFHLAVVLESGHVVGRRLDAQDESKFVVDLDRGLAKTMPDAGALDPRCESTANLLGELGRDLVAEEGGYVFGFDCQNGLPGKLLIEGFEGGLRAEHQISGVLDLHETPVVGVREDVEHRTGLLGVAIEDMMQLGRREVIGQGLRPLPVINAQEGVVDEGEADPGGAKLASQPAVTVAIELETERTPSRHAQIDQAQLGVDEVEVIMQAFAAVRAQEGAMRAFVVPRPITVAGLHRRDDMHQARMVAAPGEYLGDDVFFADVVLGNVFNSDACSTGQLGSAGADAIAERFGKPRIVEDADSTCRQKCRHALCVAHPRQCAGDDHPIVTREHAGKAIAVTLRQQLPQPPLPLPASPANILSCLVPAGPA
jgi:hypothetical protein